MLRNAGVTLALVVLTGCGAARIYEPPTYKTVSLSDTLTTALATIRGTGYVAGSRVGPAGRQSVFYGCAKECLKAGTEADFIEMLADTDPVVRVMGVYCLANTDRWKHRALLKSTFGDQTGVTYQPSGCKAWKATVGEVARAIYRDPEYLSLDERMLQQSMRAMERAIERAKERSRKRQAAEQ